MKRQELLEKMASYIVMDNQTDIDGIVWPSVKSVIATLTILDKLTSYRVMATGDGGIECVKNIDTGTEYIEIDENGSINKTRVHVFENGMSKVERCPSQL